MLICPKCGYDNELGRIFCHSCGDKLDLSNIKPATAAEKKLRKAKRETANVTRWIVRLCIVGVVLLIGALLFSLGLFGALFRFIKRRDIILRASFVSLSLYVGHSLFENPLFSVHVLPVFLLVVSLLAIRENTSEL